MQHAAHNRATIRVADRTDVSGRVTADEGKLDRFHNRIRMVCVLVAATLILPVLAYAQNNQGDNQIAALRAQITTLQTQVNTLKGQLANVLLLNAYVSVDPNPENGVAGPNITFHGANIHITDGLNTGTNDNGGTLSGLGNLIIGYDEDPALVGSPLSPGDRGGSHNLVIGRYHRFTQVAFGGLVAGEGNTIKVGLASVTGGLNTVTGLGASINGGLHNTASGEVASVTGGFSNTASGFGAVVIGGSGVMATSQFSIGPQPLTLFPFP